MSSVELSIVVPCFREGLGLDRALHKIADASRASVSSMEIVAVDDGSSDDTWEIITKCRVDNVHVRGVRLSRNFGKEAAIVAGLTAAQGRAVVVMDADLEHPPELIPGMIAAWKAGALIVNGCKITPQPTSRFRSIATRAFYAVFKMSAGMDLRRDSDFKLLDRSVVAALGRFPERVRFFRGLSRSLGFEQVDLDYSPASGTRSASGFSTFGLLRYAVRAVVAFTSRPLRWLGVVGIMGFALALVLGGHTLYMKITGRAAEGFSTVILLLLATSSIQLIGMGLLGEYIAALYEESKQRPQYLVAAIHDGRTDRLASGLSDGLAPCVPESEG